MSHEKPSPRQDAILIGYDAAAELLGVCRRQVESMVATGKLPTVKVGRRRMFRPEALRQWAKDSEK